MKNNINICSKKECTGCSACYNTCPKNAIVMKIVNGFYYPCVDEKKCINCGLCLNVCQIKSERISKSNILKTYAFQNPNNEDIKKSSSGGFFIYLANWIIKHNGFVCGVILDNNVARHIITNEIDMITKMQGSKYVESDLNDVFKKIKVLLNEGKMVLFTGTPCQNKGLKLFLKSKHSNLYQMDFVCEGVPSTNFLKSYISYFEKKKRCKVTKIEFRNKKFGWGLCANVEYISDDKLIKNIYEKGITNPYLYYFTHTYFNRRTCYNCKLVGEYRFSDFTVGDFWGDKNPMFEKSKGTSFITINSDKAEELLNGLGILMLNNNLIPVELQDVQHGNERLANSMIYKKLPKHYEIVEKNNGYVNFALLVKQLNFKMDYMSRKAFYFFKTIGKKQ